MIKVARLTNYECWRLEGNTIFHEDVAFVMIFLSILLNSVELSGKILSTFMNSFPPISTLSLALS